MRKHLYIFYAFFVLYHIIHLMSMQYSNHFVEQANPESLSRVETAEHKNALNLELTNP